MNPYIVGVVVPVVLTFLFRSKDPKRRRGVPVDAGGDTGVTVRNRRFDSPVETAWEGVTTLAELFEEACRKHGGETLLLGTRELISREVETGHDGRTFEKLHLGDYRWLSYADAFDAVSSFASGLAALGHATEQRAAIFADTREEWFLALQGCFRRNVTVVTIYASLGEEALCYSLNELPQEMLEMPPRQFSVTNVKVAAHNSSPTQYTKQMLLATS